MNQYAEFLETKAFNDIATGHDVPLDDINPQLFEFQRVLVRWALSRGRAALFADTGLGKSAMQIEWARHVCLETGGDVLILAPLAVAAQTCREGDKFGTIVKYAREPGDWGIIVTNYEMMDRFDLSKFAGIVVDESSILKHYTSKIREKIITASQTIPYRLSCTATPSPNDYMELANQAEFLGVMRRMEMLSMFFTHDSGETSKWRLKGHGKTEFWKWMSTWAAVIRKPSDLGYPNDGYDLPSLIMHEHVVTTSGMFDGQLFPKAAQTLSEQRQAQRESISERVQEVADLVNRGGTWIVWCHLNDESAQLVKAIDGAVEVRGSDSLETKESRLNEFSEGTIRVLVTKPSIAGHGMNWQHCHQIAFVGLSHSFEQFYQAIRRCWRFGQLKEVNAHLFTAEAEGQVLASIKRKEINHEDMSNQMVEHMRELTKAQIDHATVSRSPYMTDQAVGEGWQLMLGDCVERTQDIESETIDYTLFSPPFSSLYTYSNSDRDMGNCVGDGQFFEHFNHLLPELFRITKPGRLLSFHCMNLFMSKQAHGFIGMRDFRGDLIRAFTEAGWIYHSEVCIWKDPVVQMQRTKALGLLHKQLKKDAAMSRQGTPDYLVTMRKPGENPNPVTNTNESYPVSEWQQVASPVWMDIKQSKTLNYRSARENDDERHIAPLQLEVIERAIRLWTNEGDTVFSPFAGIGSEGYVAIQMNRRFIGVELKKSYWDLAQENLHQARTAQGGLFA